MKKSLKVGASFSYKVDMNYFHAIMIRVSYFEGFPVLLLCQIFNLIVYMIWFLEQIHHDQAHADFYYLSELIKDYIGLVGAVKDVFQVSNL